MRPSDENQAGSTRPNLTSSSRRATANEDGILASLERSSTASQLSRSWMIAGGSVAALLTAIVAWLAYSNATSVRSLPVSAVKRAPAYAPAEAPPPARSLAPAGELAVAGRPAAIVDEPAGIPGAAPAVEPVRPPLVMLPPEEGGIAAPPAELLRAESIAAMAPPPLEATPAEKPSAPEPAAASLPAAAKPSRPVLAQRAVQAPRPAAKPVRAAVRPADGKKARAAPAPKPVAPEVIDSDIALLSAILAHSSRHAVERAQQEACPDGKKCPPKAQAQP